MKNVTIALDDETHRQARIRAAELGTSLSALVKSYLERLAVGGGPAVTEVREVQMSFTAKPGPLASAAVPNPNNAPYFVDGKWVFTRDGKPRKPGAMRHMWVSDDFDEWPDGFLDALYGEDTEAAKNWWKPFAQPPQKPQPK